MLIRKRNYMQFDGQNMSYSRDSRWKVFTTTTWEMYRHMGLRFMLIITPIFVIISISRHGFDQEALIESVLFFGLFAFAFFILSIGVGVQAAVFWYRKNEKE